MSSSFPLTATGTPHCSSKRTKTSQASTPAPNHCHEEAWAPSPLPPNRSPPPAHRPHPLPTRHSPLPPLSSSRSSGEFYRLSALNPEDGQPFEVPSIRPHITLAHHPRPSPSHPSPSPVTSSPVTLSPITLSPITLARRRIALTLHYHPHPAALHHPLTPHHRPRPRRRPAAASSASPSPSPLPHPQVDNTHVRVIPEAHQGPWKEADELDALASLECWK